MPKADQRNYLRTLIWVIIAVPVIAYLLYFAYQKNTESATRAKQCETKCTDQGYGGYEFQWNILSGPVCKCFKSSSE